MATPTQRRRDSPRVTVRRKSARKKSDGVYTTPLSNEFAHTARNGQTGGNKMKAQILRAMSVVVSLGAALALSGCGGGGGTAMTPPPGDGGMTPMPAPPVPTLAESLASPDNQFTPVTAAQRASGDPRSEALTDNFRVTSISSDGAGGFHVTFVRGGVETSVHFEKGAFPDKTGGRPGEFFFVETDGGGEFWFWSQHSYDVDRASEPRHRYFDEIDAGFWVPGERHRYMLVYGHRTETAGLPAGTALYTGRFYTRGQLKDDPNRSGRQDYEGPVRLVADFRRQHAGREAFPEYGFADTTRSGNRSPWEDLPATNRFRVREWADLGRAAHGRVDRHGFGQQCAR